MKLHLNAAAGNAIRAHAPGRVVVNEHVYTTSIVVLPDRVITDLLPEAFAQLRADHFQRLAALGPEVLLLGTGARLRFPDPALTAELMGRGIGLEVMGTAAACRTYNILAADGRKVAAAILLIPPAADPAGG